MKHLFQSERMPKPFRKGLAPFVIGMLIIPVVWFAVFYVAVNIKSILMAFRVVDGIGDNGSLNYVWGLGNFADFFKEFRQEAFGIKVAFINTLKYFSLNFFFIIPLTYFVSYFMYKKVLGYKFFRVLFYTPSIVSGVAMVIIYKNMIGGYGPLYEFLALLGIKLPALLSSYTAATPTIMMYCVWVGFGVNIVLYQGAMGRVPEETIEAGKIDGINWWKELVFVITPMVWPTISTTLILAMTGLFNSSGPIVLFDTGGQYNTSTISYFIYQQVHDESVYNYPAAIGIFFTVISVPVVFGFRYFMNKVDPDVEY